MVKIRIVGFKGDLFVSRDNLASGPNWSEWPYDDIPIKNGICYDLKHDKASELVEEGIAVYEDDYRESVYQSSDFLSLESISVLNRDEVLGKLREDFKDLEEKEKILIYCPFVGLDDCKRFLKMRSVKDSLEKGSEIMVVTRPISDYKDRKGRKGEAIRKLINSNIETYGREGFHEKGIFVGEEIKSWKGPKGKIKEDVTRWNIGYIGSANILSYPSSSDIMVRFENRELCKKIVEKIGLPTEEELY